MLRGMNKLQQNRRVFGLAVLAFVSLLAVPAVAAANVKVKNNAFMYNGVRYFRGKAENIRLGSFGQKKTPLTQANYLQVHNQVAPGNLSKVKVHFSGPYSIDWNKVSNTDIGANVTFIKNNGAKGSLSREAAKSANLKLVKIHMNKGTIVNLLNKHAGAARNYLANEGNDGRVVGEVWVVMEGNLASQVTTSGSVSASGSQGGIKVDIKAGGSSNKTTSITLPPESTFAYLMYKVKKWKDKKTVVVDLEDDQHGPF